MRAAARPEWKAAAAKRAAVAPGGSVCCACHAKARKAAAPLGLGAAVAPGSSVCCACHAKSSRGPAAAATPAATTRKAVCWPRSCDELCCDNMMKWSCDKWGLRSGAVMSCAVISGVRNGAVMSCEGGAAEGRDGRRRRTGGIHAKNKNPTQWCDV